MNKYCIKSYLNQQLVCFSSTLKQTSHDDANDEYLCHDEATKPVYDFDAYVRDNFDQTVLPASPDAIYIGEKKLYFVEFKNQFPSDIDTAQIKRKFMKGTDILQKLLSKFLPRDVKFIFCVVHKEKVQCNRHFIASHIEGRSTLFGLAEENARFGNFYDEVITESVDFYTENFHQLNCD